LVVFLAYVLRSYPDFRNWATVSGILCPLGSGKP